MNKLRRALHHQEFLDFQLITVNAQDFKFSLRADECVLHVDEKRTGYFLTTKEDCGRDNGICSPNLFLFPLGCVDGLFPSRLPIDKPT